MLILTEPDKLLLIPGPTPVQREILTALSEPTVSHTSPALADIIRTCQRGLRQVCGTENASVFVFSGSGTLAQEAAVVNVVAPGETLLVASNGYFGDRFAAIAQAHGVAVQHLKVPWGETVTPEVLEDSLRSSTVRAVAMTQVDTSTGTNAPVKDLARVAQQYGALVIVDAVCSLGGMAMAMDEWGVDIVLSGAQKALGVPPGLSILAVSEQALTRRRSLHRVSTFYADLLNWEASMENPLVYFSTHAVNLFYALLASLKIIEREGLESRFVRHEQLAHGFRAGMRELGFTPFTNTRCLAPTLSVLHYPAGIDDESFRAELSQRGILAAGCLGDFKGKGIRFGHMGNITETEILQGLRAVEASLLELEIVRDPGRCLVAAVTAMAGQRVPSPS